MKTNDVERRYIDMTAGVLEEIRGENGEGTYKLRGTPVVYNREVILYETDDFRLTERIEAGAAREALLRAEQYLFWNHDQAKPMAARKNNTLSVREDSSGVHIEADASGTVWGREGVEAIRSGLVDKMSFGFLTEPEGEVIERSVENGKRVVKRTIRTFSRLVEFSPVTRPAYQDTEISARSGEFIKEFEAEEKRREETKAKIDGLLNEFGPLASE